MTIRKFSVYNILFPIIFVFFSENHSAIKLFCSAKHIITTHQFKEHWHQMVYIRFGNKIPTIFENMTGNYDKLSKFFKESLFL